MILNNNYQTIQNKFLVSKSFILNIVSDVIKEFEETVEDLNLKLIQSCSIQQKCKCPKCGAYFSRHTDKKKTTLGDSNCEGKYWQQKVIKQHMLMLGMDLKNLQQVQEYNRSYKYNLFITCTAIDRNPVVARWRNDVDYVAARIYCFQPFCVTGEMDPPANPLICPQFCVTFNDLDNIALTGRHYSGFVMFGIQKFNYADKHIFFKEECVEFNSRWLTEELEINIITYIEDV